MLSRTFIARQFAFAFKKQNKDVEQPSDVRQSQSKIVYAYINNELVGQYDSITKCAQLLGLSRAMTKKAIDCQTVLDNGFILTFNKK